MNQIKEAAIAIHEAETAHSGLAIAMHVSHKFVHLVGRRGDLELSRSVTWTEIEQARLNVLTAAVGLITNKLTAKAV